MDLFVRLRLGVNARGSGLRRPRIADFAMFGQRLVGDASVWLVRSLGLLRGLCRVGLWVRLAALAAAFLGSGAVALAAGSPSVGGDTARAQRVVAEIQSINVDLGRSAEAWDGARYRLGLVQARERATRVRLAVAERSAREAELRLGRMLVGLYKSDRLPLVVVLFGATSLDDLLTRFDDEQRVSSADASVARQALAARAVVQRQSRTLAREIVGQRRLVAQFAARRSAITAKLAERQRLLASIRNEIVLLRVKQRARERQLAREARLRLAEQVAAERRAEAIAAAQARLQRQLRTRAAAAADARADIAAPPAAPAATTPTTPPTSTATTAPPPTPTIASHDPRHAADPTPSPVPAPAPTTIAGGNTQIVSIALNYLGIPYHWGGASPQTGFDCSGLVMYVFAQVGTALPHFAAAQYHYGTPVPRDQLEPGDVVFFDALNHVGIYIGNDQFIHAPHTGDVVRISNLNETWYSTHYVGARRIT